jgi:hypothetical protein
MLELDRAGASPSWIKPAGDQALVRAADSREHIRVGADRGFERLWRYDYE